MGQQRHFDRVRGLVSGQSGVPEAEITLETRLFEDLRMDRASGEEFLAIFADEFGVDIAPAAPLNYFNEQSWAGRYSLMIPIAAYFSGRFHTHVRRASRGLRALSVRDLVASARAGRWITPSVPRSDANFTRLSRAGWLAIGASVAIPALLSLRHYLLHEVSAERAIEITLSTAMFFWTLMAVRLLLALPWLKRLDAAATHEEQPPTAAD